MRWATVITDASYCDKTKKAGWAAWIRVDGIAHPIKKYASFKGKIGSSTIAEKKAAINGIWLAKKYGADAVLLQSDCLAVVHVIDKTTKKRNVLDEWNRWMENAGVLDVLVNSSHVKGHSTTQDARSYVNRWCDRHSNKARKSA